MPRTHLATCVLMLFAPTKNNINRSSSYVEGHLPKKTPPWHIKLKNSLPGSSNDVSLNLEMESKHHMRGIAGSMKNRPVRAKSWNTGDRILKGDKDNIFVPRENYTNGDLIWPESFHPTENVSPSHSASPVSSGQVNSPPPTIDGDISPSSAPLDQISAEDGYTNKPKSPFPSSSPTGKVFADSSESSPSENNEVIPSGSSNSRKRLTTSVPVGVSGSILFCVLCLLWAARIRRIRRKDDLGELMLANMLQDDNSSYKSIPEQQNNFHDRGSKENTYMSIKGESWFHEKFQKLFGHTGTSFTTSLPQLSSEHERYEEMDGLSLESSVKINDNDSGSFQSANSIPTFDFKQPTSSLFSFDLTSAEWFMGGLETRFRSPVQKQSGFECSNVELETVLAPSNEDCEVCVKSALVVEEQYEKTVFCNTSSKSEIGAIRSAKLNDTLEQSTHFQTEHISHGSTRRKKSTVVESRTSNDDTPSLPPVRFTPSLRPSRRTRHSAVRDIFFFLPYTGWTKTMGIFIIDAGSENTYPVVKSVSLGSPLVGRLFAGDAITHVDDIQTSGFAAQDVINHISHNSVSPTSSQADPHSNVVRCVKLSITNDGSNFRKSTKDSIVKLPSSDQQDVEK
eukprot:scaffold126363_cov52-Attheya_sp.AAC.4